MINRRLEVITGTLLKLELTSLRDNKSFGLFAKSIYCYIHIIPCVGDIIVESCKGREIGSVICSSPAGTNNNIIFIACIIYHFHFNLADVNSGFGHINFKLDIVIFPKALLQSILVEFLKVNPFWNHQQGPIPKWVDFQKFYQN